MVEAVRPPHAAATSRSSTWSRVADVTTAVALVALNGWLSAAFFAPVTHDGGDVEYILVAASLFALLAWAAASAALVAAVVAFTRPRSTAHLAPLRWLTLSLVPLLALVVPGAERLAPAWYVLWDLRWCWWALVGLDIVRRAGWRLPTWRRSWLGLAVMVVPVVMALAFTPNLRFDGTLHGDEPKYLRVCENLFQGRGFDISDTRSLPDTSSGEYPQLLRNLGLFARAVPEELRLLVSDARHVLTGGGPPRLVGGEPTPGFFFNGKHPGTVYQLHNPGVSFVLLPAYVMDRIATGGGVGYADQFQASMPALHVELLVLFALYAATLHLLLHTWCHSRRRAALLAILGTVTMPAGAFAFQIYPEIPAGIIVFIVTRVLVSERRILTRGSAAIYGALAAFLPWLHVRFLLVTAVLVCAMFVRVRHTGRTRLRLMAGALVPLALLSLYTYRMTGSLLPVATYGSDAPLSLIRMVRGMPGFALDRVWGLLPHAPIYLLAFAGVGPAWRRSRWNTAIIVGVVAAVAIPAAGHGYWAGGSTPGRYIVAVAPLLMTLVAEALDRWERRRVFLAAFVTLALLSIQTAVRYNLSHVKEVGPLVAREFAGWRPNLLFPSMGTDSWTAGPGDIVLLVAWALALGGLVAWGIAESRRPVLVGGEATPVLRLDHVLAALFSIALVGLVVAVGSPYDRALTIPGTEARAMALDAFSSLDHCIACYSSRAGAVPPTIALGNETGFVDIQRLDDAPITGQPVRLRIRPRTEQGAFVISTVRVDFGDGAVETHHRQFADLDVTHVFDRAGEFSVHAWVKGSTGRVAEADVPVRIADP